jgi:hypothetical protein
MSSETAFTAGYGYAPDMLTRFGTASAAGPAFLSGGGLRSAEGVSSGAGMAVTTSLSGWAVAAAFVEGSGWDPAPALGLARNASRASADRMRIQIGRDLGDVQMIAAIERLEEAETFLGSAAAPELGVGGSATDLLELGAAAPLPERWSLDVSARVGMTRLERGGGLMAAHASPLLSSGFSAALNTMSLLRTGDRFGFQLSQPLRFERASLPLSLPVAYDYGSGAATYAVRGFDLTPSGREIAFEAAYALPLPSGFLNMSSFVRRHPGHRADAPADIGAAVQLERRF